MCDSIYPSSSKPGSLAGTPQHNCVFFAAAGAAGTLQPPIIACALPSGAFSAALELQRRANAVPVRRASMAMSELAAATTAPSFFGASHATNATALAASAGRGLTWPGTPTGFMILGLGTTPMSPAACGGIATTASAADAWWLRDPTPTPRGTTVLYRRPSLLEGAADAASVSYQHSIDDDDDDADATSSSSASSSSRSSGGARHNASAMTATPGRGSLET